MGEPRLRPLVEADLPMFRRFDTEPGLVGLDWAGFRDPEAVARRFATDGYLGTDNGRLVVETGDREAAGFVSWVVGQIGAAGRSTEIGIALLPEFRGRGIGWRAQDQLCRYLFEHHPIQRIQAGTHPENLAEQRSLVKAGFRFEAVIRACEFRAGQWRDGYLYSRLRDDPPAGTPVPPAASSRHLVDPELLGPLDAYQVFDLAVPTLPETRAETNRRTAAVYVPREGVQTEERLVPGPPDGPEVRLIVSRPVGGGEERRPAVLWIHGGGYVLGTADRSRGVLDMLCTELGCLAASVEYRLAPETPHPGALEDCYAALVWLHEHADELGIDPDRIAIGGESAGGGLAAALALLARDRGAAPVRLQVLVYPMLDDRTVTTPDPHPYAGEFVWTPASNEFGWRAVLGDKAPGSDGVSPYAAPARRADLSGLPPAVIVVGTLDLFVDEDLEYGRRLVRAGVPTELHLYPGGPHGFFSFDATGLGARVRGDVTAALGRAFAPA